MRGWRPHTRRKIVCAPTTNNTTTTTTTTQDAAVPFRPPTNDMLERCNGRDGGCTCSGGVCACVLVCVCVCVRVCVCVHVGAGYFCSKLTMEASGGGWGTHTLQQ